MALECREISNVTKMAWHCVPQIVANQINLVRVIVIFMIIIYYMAALSNPQDTTRLSHDIFIVTLNCVS